ncbi:unnamed protein product [Rotaria socialis]|uniref:Formamidase n=1 Tax=Rotaria socialis TaxID=392032 RepID=A0A817Q9J9_9BILA|nr:unnamed protein product [Rotaria socialis]CAF3401058.1 unnamed protein product [Rotaria socialis]CAF3517023.1 unnamed protein product [Rotaria socialis]CAF3612028.1 unnamed protein product [Rotaria socialis]CAF3619273.1 unnamed protein product [Rotaria socialis]
MMLVLRRGLSTAISYAAKPLLSVDLNRPATNQLIPLHNRWHPDIPSVVSVRQGDVFRVECVDWTGGQIGNNDTADDVKNVDLTRIHYLSGPIEVEGARPGDVLAVDILDVGPLSSAMWGFTGIFDKNNGGGFLADVYPNAHKAIWDFSGIYATSRHIKNVRFAGLTHPGIIGCAPSHELLSRWNTRERDLINRCTHSHHQYNVLANLPNEKGALLGRLKFEENKEKWQKVANEGARTIPPREHGGNTDIKNISRGSRVYLPVYVNGAKLSLGDIHFSQGDGEIAFCGAIEMSGYVDLHLDIIKDGMSRLSINSPLIQPGPVEPRYSNYLTFQGISVNDKDKQHFLDATLAYRQACFSAIRYLKRFGYTEEQLYCLLSAAPVEGRIGSIVDIPNACCTLSLPIDIFSFDIRPETVEQNNQNISRGQLAKTTF